MKPNLLVLFVVFLCFNFSNLKSDDINKFLFPIGEANVKYLKGLMFQNNFEHAYLMYKLREIRLVSMSSGQVTQYIPFQPQTSQESKGILGSPTQGIDYTLANHTKTESFVVPEGNQILFNRTMEVSVPCNYVIPIGPELGGTGDYRDQAWYVGIGNIQDLSEFVIQAVKSNDTTQKYTIDSVGVGQNPNSALAQRYGTNPDTNMIYVNLPSNWTGQLIYLQVVPKRVGSTPLGMTFRKYTMFNSTNVNKLSDWVRDSLCYNEEINYSDNYLLQYGHLPTGLRMYKNDYFTKKYYQYYNFQPNADSTYWSLSHGNTTIPGRNDVKDSKNYSDNGKKASIKSVTPQPVNGQNCTIELQNNLQEINCTLYIYDNVGQFKGEVWRGSLKSGNTRFGINTNALNSGFYNLVLVSSDKGFIDQMPLIINK